VHDNTVVGTGNGQDDVDLLHADLGFALGGRP
jgi:hypothetical protein